MAAQSEAHQPVVVTALEREHRRGEPLQCAIGTDGSEAAAPFSMFAQDVLLLVCHVSLKLRGLKS
jgi:hypothetical protein